MIPESGEKLHASGQQRRVWFFELVLEILLTVAPIDVVAEHQHDVEGKRRASRREHLSDLVLGSISRAGVAEHREVDRPFLLRQGNVLACEGNANRERQSRCESDVTKSVSGRHSGSPEGSQGMTL